MTAPSTSWKEATDTTSGDASKYGVPDGLLLYAQLFNGDLNVDNVHINSPWFFTTSKLYFLNTAETYGFLIDSSAAIVADRTVSFPLMVGDGTFVIDDMIQTISSKKVGNWLDATEVAAPSSPAASTLRIYADSTSNQLTVKNSSGTVTELTTNSSTQTLTNKTVTQPTMTILDNVFSILDNADNTKIAKFELSGLTTATTRTYTLPDADTTLGGGDMLLGTTQTVSASKTYSANSIFQDTIKIMFGTGSDSSIVDTGSGMLIDIDEQNAGSKSLIIESDATALLTINDTSITSSVFLDVPDIETATVSARDGTLAQTIADSTGVTTFVSGTVLVAPVLGTPDSGALTNCTSIPVANATGILPDANMPNLTGDITTSEGAVATTLSSTLNVIGTQQQWIPAGAFGTVTTNGAEFVELELATNDIMLQTFNFDTTTSEKIQFWWHPPSNWDAGTITFQAYWTAASGSGTVIFSLAGQSFADSDAIDQALGTAVTSTDTLLTANDIHISPESAAVTIADATKNEPVILQVARDISDTLGVDAKLIGIKIIYTIDTATSS